MVTPAPTVGALQRRTAPWLCDVSETIAGALADPDATSVAIELNAPVPFALTVATRNS